MVISELLDLYQAHPQIKELEQIIHQEKLRKIYVGGMNASAPSLVFGALTKSSQRPFVFLLNDLEEAGYFYHDLVQLLGNDTVLFFPSSFRRAVKYGQRDAANEILRTEVLSRLQQNKGTLCIVSYPDAISEKVVSSDELSNKTLELSVGEKIDTSFVAEVLQSYGFERVDYVYEAGQYAVRGSIIDVFSFSNEFPFRIDFFGDEIESIRIFEVETQLSKGKKEQISIVPDLSTGSSFTPFFDVLPKKTILCAKDLAWNRDRIEAVHSESLSSQAVIAQEAGETIASLEGLFIDGSDFIRRTLDFKMIEFGADTLNAPEAIVRFHGKAQPIFHKNFDLIHQMFSSYLELGYKIYICSDSQKQTDRIRDIFADREENIPFEAVERTIHEGYADDQLKICLFTDHQIFDRFHKYNLKSDKARSGKVALSLKELHQFSVGDYIVHIDHGVGKFAGLFRIPNGETSQEVIKLVYANDDVVFVSIHSLHKVSKYKGKDNEPPRVNKLGTGAWDKLKNRTKKKIKDIARDLIKLYSKRKQEKGFSFSVDSFLQNELEASFKYEETPDQLKTMVDVKNDMESARPMDRLVCGDVGFGKTEIAVRAAFKAVADDKQVAVLVPTTVLAYQHYETFRKRLKDFPCKVDYLSRARTPSQTREIIKELKSGETSIVIGTHKLLGKTVQFKDLGLLIVDEEQKFGVSVKEKLRQIKVNVDTLTLTATPIPRTLQFSLIGARDLSVISTPPPNRYPIQTEVHTFSHEVIVDAINFEMSRNGQVFLVNNRVSNLVELQAMIQRDIPDCRVCIGHGQMEPAKLEKIILDFVNYDYDVLIATTIIESGIDMPNVNTIIVNQAQNFGLSALHQLRGRVGRSNKKAFCYLLAPPLTSLNTEARRRLQAIENFSDLGSGIHIAMQDLDIRGAGNMLGAEQSGFIADLGYETYQKILSEAVQELKNDEFAELYAKEGVEATEEKYSGDEFVEECTLESDLELLLPDSYVVGSSERMLLYRELDNLVLDKDVEAFKVRLIDRFGPLPHEAEELLHVVALKRIAAHLGIERIFLKAGRMSLFFVTNLESPYYQSEAFGKMIEYMSKHPKQTNLREKGGKRSMVISEIKTVERAVSVLQEILSIKF